MKTPPAEISLRPWTKNDEAFTKDLFIANSQAMFAHLAPEQQEILTNIQLLAQQRDYRQRWPQAQYLIIQLRNTAAGQLIINPYPEYDLLIDIAVLPSHQNSGIATRVLEILLRQAQSREVPVRLSVIKDNPALQLYKRIGFTVTGASGTHYRMEMQTTHADH
ncbi:GNAT family N-acetyltransferase [Thalassomonas actiniarum]|uniref:GNAT family N-acetyltransferase n=1 Tax=Thalassomonas actiniarum TaxID=485447 RepID=A0AAE9YNG9_9GAMM|nr:GNAT family N-acetyltransferase [Thalassomonas actiniarum]WDD97304.1 GNAT family N-acetyltransferase [Thalassomonas actiniarum]